MHLVLCGLLLIHQISAQNSILILVSPGPPTSLPYNTALNYVPDVLSPNGARQQYILGLYFLARYKSIFSKEGGFNFTFGGSESFDAYSGSSLRLRSSAQAFLQGLMKNQVGDQVTGKDQTVYSPPYIDGVPDGLGRESLPGDMMQGMISTNSERNFTLLDYFDDYCKSAREDIDREYDSFCIENSNLVKQEDFDMNWLKSGEISKFKDYLTHYHHVASYMINEAMPNIIDRLKFLTLSRAAMLTHIAGISESTTRQSKLKVMDVYEEMKKFIEKTESDERSPRASVMHLTEEQFATAMVLMQMTNRDCVKEMIMNHTQTEDEEGLGCMGFPPYSSSITFEFMDSKAVNMLYNGKKVRSFGDITEFKNKMMEWINENDEEYYCEGLLRKGSLWDSLLLIILLLSIAFMGTSILFYLRTRLDIKCYNVERSYIQKARQIQIRTTQNHFSQTYIKDN